MAPLTPRRAGIAVAAATLVAGALTLNHSLVGGFYDDGLYAGIAIALGKGLGYVHPHLPGTPTVVHYPPLYPLVLAPLFAAFSVPTAAFVALILNVVLGAASAGLVAAHALRRRLMGDELPAWLTPACVLAAAIAIPVLTVQSVLFAEPLFGLLLAGSVLLADAAPERSRPMLTARGSGIFAALALLTRSIALAAGVGLPLYLWLVRRRPRVEAAAVGVPVLLAAAGWAGWITLHRGGMDPALVINYGSYGDTIRQAGLSVIWRSVPDLLRPLGALTLGWLPGAWLYYTFALPAACILVYGVVIMARRSAIGLTLVAYLLILSLWPFPSDRFLWAVLPWLVLTFGAGAIAVARSIPSVRIVVLVVVATMVAGYAQYQIRGAIGGWSGLQRARISANFAELLPGLASLPDTVVIATDDEALVWLYTRRTAVPFYVYGYAHGSETEPPAADHRRYLERQGVTRVLFSGFGSGSDRELDALLGAYPGWLTIERTWAGGRALFRVNRDR